MEGKRMETEFAVGKGTELEGGGREEDEKMELCNDRCNCYVLQTFPNKEKSMLILGLSCVFGIFDEISLFF